MIAEAKAQIYQVFKSFDKDNSGYIDKSELFAVAKQLNVELTEAAVEKLMAHVDRNKDNLISFDEFWEWWQCGKDPNLEALVYMKLQISNWVSKVHSEFTRLGFSKEVSKDQRVNEYYIALNNGDSPNHFSLSLQAYLALEGVEKLIQEHSRATYPEGASVNLAFIIRCIQPQKVVGVLQDLIQKARQKRENSDDQLFKQVIMPILETFEIRTVDDYLHLIIPLKFQKVEELVGAVLPQLKKMVPPEFFLEFALMFGTKNSLKKMMTRKVPLVKQIMEGFLAELRARFRSQAFELLVMSLKAAGEGYMVEKNILKDGSEHLFLLLRAAKCHLAFRSVEDVEQLFKDLGLEDLSKEQPTLQEILEEVFAASESSGPQDDLMKDEDFRKLVEFCQENIVAQGSVELKLPVGLVKLEFNLEGLQEIFMLATQKGQSAQSKKAMIRKKLE